MEKNWKTEWDLEKHYYKEINDPQLEIDFKVYEDQMKYVVEKYTNKLRNFETSNEWNQWFEDVDEHSSIDGVVKIFQFLSFKQSLNTQDQEVLKLHAKYENKHREINEQLLFIDDEYKAIGYEKLMELSKKEELKDFSKVFYDKAQNLKYELDSKTEKAFVIKSRANVSGCNTALYEELKSSFMYEFIDENNEKKELTEEEISSYVLKENRELRERASKILRERFLKKENQIVFGNVYSSIVKDCVSNIKLRGYETVMSPRNIAEDMNDKTIDLLMNHSIEKIYPLVQRFLKLKKKALGYDKIHIWDVYAPVGKTEKKFDFEKGVELFLDTIKHLDEEIYIFSKDMFEKGKVDVFPKKGKVGGAYCSYYKNQPSMVLLNYNDTLEDVSTIAHEFGHAYHGFKQQNQPMIYYDAGLCLAETASVFNELYLLHNLLKQLGDNNIEEKIHLLNQELGTFFATIAEQIMFTNFEKRVHEIFMDGEDLTYEDFNCMFREELVKMYGDTVEFDTKKEDEVRWSRKPHIFEVPFYCYSYAFGQILSISLYEMYLEEGDNFIPKYKRILEAGSSKTPQEILSEVGIDINSVDFYDRCEKFISKKVDLFEELVNNK